MRPRLTLYTLLTAASVLFSAWFASNHLRAQPAVPVSASERDDVKIGDGMPEWLKASLILGGLGAGPLIAIWYQYYDVKHVKPRLERAHREQVAAIVTQYLSEGRAREERHAKHYEMINANNREDIHALRQSIDKLSDSVDKLGGCKFTPGQRGDHHAS